MFARIPNPPHIALMTSRSRGAPKVSRLRSDTSRGTKKHFTVKQNQSKYFMGYTENCHPCSKTDFIAERTRAWDNSSHSGRTIKHSLRGGCLWKMCETTEKATGKTERFIALDLIGCRNGCWGYKDICESMGPYETNCPLTWFAEVPDPDPTGSWRAACRAAAARKQSVKSFAASLRIGQTVELVNTCIPHVEITHINGRILGSYNGRIYRVTPRFLKIPDPKTKPTPKEKVLSAICRLESLAA